MPIDLAIMVSSLANANGRTLDNAKISEATTNAQIPLNHFQKI